MIIDAMPYIQQCAKAVAPSTMQAIIKTESRNNPLAIGLNNHKKLSYQPGNFEQAKSWVEYLDTHGYDFDVGLGQVNIRNIRKFGYKASDMLDPCKNLTVASYILSQNYKIALTKSTNSRDALLKAISAYNTGNYQNGFHNGYVQKVVRNADNTNSNVAVSPHLHIEQTLTKNHHNHQFSRTIVYAKNKNDIQASKYAMAQNF